MENANGLPATSLNQRVLVVDDDPDYANSQGELIRSHGYEVEIVTSAQAAHQALGTFSPEVVLIDVRLGKVDGIDLLGEFLAHEPSPTCIMITGYASIESAVEALKAGAYDYLTKPVSPNDLFRTLDRCFERIRLEAERTDALDKLDTRNRELEYLNKRLQRVVENMGEITCSTSLPDLCRKLLEKVAHSMGAEGGSVYLREGDQLVLEYSLDPGHAPAIIPMPLNTNSVLGRVMEQGEAVLVSDAASSDGLMLSGWSGYRDESLLALPLTGQDNDIKGVLSLHTKQQPPFTPQDRDLGRILLAASCETLRAVKALESLQESQSMLQMIMDSNPDCIRVLDQEGKLLYINPAGLAFIEADAIDQIEGDGCVQDIVDPEYRDAFKRLGDSAYKGESGTLECCLTGLRGTRRWIEVNAVPLRDRLQNITGCLSVARDITEDKRLIEKNRQQELQLMESNKMAALGTLVAGVAHEINNPNQTIQINSGLLGQVWTDTQKILDEHVSTHGPFKLGGLLYNGVPGAHADLINDMRIGAEQIKTVVGRLRSFARPYEGIHGNIEGAQIQLNEAVQPAIALLRHAIRKGTDNFQTNLEDGLPAIQGNRQQLQQVVINLVMNALDALPDRSHGIQVDTGFNAERSCVELRVRDAGTGIEPQNMEQIMEPFYTTRREKGGTGLGLSITHSLLHDQGGTIHFESEPGKGTLVIVGFPVVKA